MSIYLDALLYRAKMIFSTNSSSVQLSCQVSDPSLSSSECPSNNWQAIQNYLDFSNSLTESYSQLNLPLASTPGSVEVTGENSLRRLRIYTQISLFADSGYDPQTVIATVPQAAVADALTATGTMWSWAASNVTTKGHGHPEDQLDAVHSITQDYYHPIPLFPASLM